jgi:glycosyltransferase involved in cell wall biosynthesis
MKILMLTAQLGYGGAETSFIRLANYLAQSMDVTVALFTSDYGKGAYALGHETLNAKIVLLDSPVRAGRLKRWWQRIKAVRKLKADSDAAISFLSGPSMVNVLAGLNSRTVISLRGSRVYDPVASRPSRLLFQYFLDPIAFWLAARIVPVSPGLKNEIKQIAGVGVLTKVRAIPPFVEIASLQHKLSQLAPEPYTQLRGEKVIVSVGRLSVEKGFHHLIRVFAELTKTEKGIKLLLVGDGPMLSELRHQCIKRGLAIDDFSPGKTSVLFAGYQKNALPLMALGKVYAMTSSTEGFPSVMLEAMAAGVPVIATDAPWGARAILSEQAEENSDPYPTSKATESDYGILMPRIDDPGYDREWVRILSECLRTEKWRELYSQKGKGRLPDYDIERIGQEWKKLIDSLVKK